MTGYGVAPELFSEAPEQSFGELLRGERLRRGMSQAELARMINYSKSHLSRVESGEKRATTALARVCDGVLKTGDALQRSAVHLGARATANQSWPKLSQLPIRPPHFTGRSWELESIDVYRRGQLDHASPLAPIVIDGCAGAGKTALAVHWAYRAAPQFSNGVLFADLNAFSADGTPATPSTILEGFLIALGVPPESVPGGLSERAAMYRDALSGKQVLVVLDNAASAEQARPMLCGSASGSLVVVTSRNRLSGLVIREGAHRVTLEALRPDEAAAFISAIARASGLDVAPEVAARVAELFGHLPLALSIATHHAMARRDPGFTSLFCRLRNGSSPLDVLSIWGDESLTMRDSLRWSYRALGEDLARAFRVIAPRCDGVDVQTAGRWLDTTRGAAAAILDALAETSLILRAEDGRYRCHPLCAAFAAELATCPGLAA